MTEQREPPPVPDDFEDGPMYDVWVQSIFGQKTQQPLVAISVNGADFRMTITPPAARKIAFDLLECAEAAEIDALLIGFLRGKRIPDPAIAQIILDFRKHRQ